MAVKGSKVIPMRVVPYRPWVSVVKYGLLLALLPLNFYLGSYMENQSQQYAAGSKDQAAQQLVAGLNQQIDILHTNAEVDRQSIEDLRQLVMTQKAQLAAADRDLRVYKELVAGNSKANYMGLSVGVFTLQPQKEAGKFNYSLTIQKLSAREGDFSGYLEFTILGQQAGTATQIALSEVSHQVTEPQIPLNFKYFQTLDGELNLPPNFIPQSVQVAIRGTDKKSTPMVETKLDWPFSDNPINKP